MPIHAGSMTRMSRLGCATARPAPSIVAEEPHRVRARLAVGQGDFLQAQHEVLARGRILDVHRPGQRAVGAGLGSWRENMQSSTGVGRCPRARRAALQR